MEDVNRLLRRLGPTIAEGFRSPRVARLADPVAVIVLAEDASDSACEVFLLEHRAHRDALEQSGWTMRDDGSQAPPGSVKVGILTDGACDEFHVPDPRIRPDWWELDPAALVTRPASRAVRAVRWGLDRLRVALGHPGASAAG